MPADSRPRIALPMPHSLDREYAERAISQYEGALVQAGAEPVRIPLDRANAEVMNLVERCVGVVLPGSKADVNPACFGAARSPHTAPADPHREAVDGLLLRDAYTWRKPIVGICYGLQSLNVFRGGSLVQHIPDFLPEEVRLRVDHKAGKVAVAHTIAIDRRSKLAQIVSAENREELGPLPGDTNRTGNKTLVPDGNELVLAVNSSHHQSANTIGEGLRVSARCPDDGIIEALEGMSLDHFVLAVQWHPERSVEADEASRAIFSALIRATIK